MAETKNFVLVNEDGTESSVSQDATKTGGRLKQPIESGNKKETCRDKIKGTGNKENTYFPGLERDS